MNDEFSKELRKLVQGMVAKMPKNKREAMEDAVVESLRTAFVEYIQKTTLEISEDIDMNPFDIMLRTTPMVCVDLLKMLLINMAANMDEDKIDRFKELADELGEFIQSAVFKIDHVAVYKETHKHMLDATMDGRIQSIKINT